MKEEESKYFVDANGTLCLVVQANVDTAFVFQVVGVFGYEVPDKIEHNLGFMIAKYKKQTEK